MANISALLEIIRTAHLGRDMRQALHDSIDAVNDDVETCGQTLSVSGSKLQLKRGSTVLSEVDMPSNISNLDDLSDVTITSATTGQVLKWNGSAWVNGSGGDTVAVTQVKTSGEKIAEITVNGVTTNIYASAGGGGGGAVDSVNGMTGDVVLDMNDINDVDINNLADGQVLAYDSSSGKFKNVAQSGGTSDYTDLANKPQINGVTLSGNKTSGDLGLSGGSNENLLLNPWFNVNTKGFTSGTALAYYSKECIDSWFGEYDYPADSSGTLTYNSNGSITVTPSYNEGYSGMVGITQIVKNKNELYGKTITLSVLINGSTLLSTSGVFTQGSGISNYHLLFGNNMRASLTFSDSNGKFSIRVGREDNTQLGESSVVINAVKLELGSVSTLALDVAPNQNLETVKCNGVMRSNPNLLINPWFTVNQRGFTSAEYSYNFQIMEPWRMQGYNSNGSGVTLNSDHSITFNCKAKPEGSFNTIAIAQKQEDMSKWYNKIYTASVLMADGRILKGIGTIGTSRIDIRLLPDPIPDNDGFRFNMVFDTNDNEWELRILNYTETDQDITIKAVKLEIGTESTLHLDNEPNYTTELLKCQRYYHRYRTQALRPTYKEDCVPEMRVNPSQSTVTIDGTTYYVNDAHI